MIKVGSRLVNNDPRSVVGGSPKIVEVVAIQDRYTDDGTGTGDPKAAPKYAVYHSGRQKVQIRLDRIITDGRQSTHGWSLLAD